MISQHHLRVGKQSSQHASCPSILDKVTDDLEQIWPYMICFTCHGAMLSSHSHYSTSLQG